MDGAREFGELKATVEALRQGVSEFRSEVREEFRDLKGRLDSHSRRLGSLERWRAWIAGGLAVLGVLWAAVLAAWKGEWWR